MEFFTYMINEKDDTDLNRKWKRCWRIENEGISFYIVMEKRLMQLRGEQTNILANLRVFGFDFSSFQIAQFHQYYDGDNCSYHLGPLFFQTIGTANCKKCRGKNQ